jgi:hypothetical protein
LPVLDVGFERGLEIGGWIPKGPLAEDGPISQRYGALVETDSADPSVRTALNVHDSDATLIVSQGYTTRRIATGTVLPVDLAATSVG